jgi:hypothetical protein
MYGSGSQPLAVYVYLPPATTAGRWSYYWCGAAAGVGGGRSSPGRVCHQLLIFIDLNVLNTSYDRTYL